MADPVPPNDPPEAPEGFWEEMRDYVIAQFNSSKKPNVPAPEPAPDPAPDPPKKKTGKSWFNTEG